MNKDRYGLTLTDYPEYRVFLDKLKALGFIGIETGFVYTRHTQFKAEPCDVCGGTKLVHGIGRYIIFDDDGEIDTLIHLCGFCLEYMESKWGVSADMM